MNTSLRAALLAAAGVLIFPFTLLAQAPAAPKAPDAPAVDARDPATPGPRADAIQPEPGLRRLDEPTNAAATESRDGTRRLAMRSNRSIVNVLADSFLPAGEHAEVVVAILGSATAEGEVSDAVVSVLGNTRVLGQLGDSAVAVLGNVYINSRVRGDVVAVMGNVELGPQAIVEGEVVCMLGQLTKDPAAIIHQGLHNIGVGSSFAPQEKLMAWIRQCLLLGRPLAFGPDLGWAWAIAGVFLGVYVLLALFFRDGVEHCVQTLTTRPGSSVVTAVLAVLLSPVAILLLIMTGVGIFLVPFVGAGLFFASLFGVAAVLAWLGLKVTRHFGDSPLAHPAVAVLLAGTIILFVYTIPVLGFVTLKLLGWLGLGVVLYTLIVAMKRERAASALAAVGPAGPVVAPMTAAPIGVGYPAGEGVPPIATGGMWGAPPSSPPPISAATLPRAGFWIRLLALGIDLIVVSLVMVALEKLLPRGMDFGAGLLLLVAIYGALLWKLRGTTIGGIVCSLKVVRLDDRPIDWATAIVRTLGCFLSLFVSGLGFIWAAIDDQQQSWHDKIAGTTVVRVPKGISLV